jgi:putative intracellular protease/amidase
VFVPLAFLPGEAFQFDWSEDWAVIAGERTKLQVAHFKLSYSRAFILRAYPQQTHEMLFAVTAGADYVAPPSPFEAFSVTTGRIVTGANPASAHITALAAIEAFERS